MSDYAPLRDAFQEINRMMIDNDRWKQEHETRKQELGLRQLQVEASLEDAKLDRAGKQLRAERAREQMTPTVFNVFDYVPNNQYTRDKLFTSSSGAKDYARRVAGRDDVDVDPITGIVRQGNGEAVTLPKFQLTQRSAGALPLIESHLDPEEMLNVNLDAINGKEASLKKELDAVPVTDVARRRALKEELNEIGTLRNQHVRKLNLDELLPLYQQRAKFYNSAMLNAAANGADEQTFLAYKTAADKADGDWRTLIGKIAERDAKIETARLKAIEAREKGDKVQQHYIGEMGDDGTITNVSVFNVPKESAGVVQPPAGMVFISEAQFNAAEKKESRTAGKWDGTKVTSQAENAFKSWVVDPTSMNGMKLDVPPASKPRVEATKRLALEALNGKKYKDEATATLWAADAVKNAERRLMDVARNLAVQKGIDPDDPKAAAIMERLVQNLANEKGKKKGDTSFIEDLGYTPRWEYRNSLDESYVNSFPEVKEER